VLRRIFFKISLLNFIRLDLHLSLLQVITLSGVYALRG
jgi:hypothetical protein